MFDRVTVITNIEVNTMKDLDYMHPIDKPADITPARLRFEAKTLRYQTGKHPAQLIDWCAERFAELEELLHYTTGCCDLAMKHRDIAEAQIEAVKELPRYDMKRGLLNPGITSREFNPDGRHVDALALQSILDKDSGVGDE